MRRSTTCRKSGYAKSSSTIEPYYTIWMERLRYAKKSRSTHRYSKAAVFHALLSDPYFGYVFVYSVAPWPKQSTARTAYFNSLAVLGLSI